MPALRTPVRYDGSTAHMSEAGDALATHPGLVSGPIPFQGGPLMADDSRDPARVEGGA